MRCRRIGWLLGILGLAATALQAAEPAPPISRLKDMCVDTVLVRDGKPVAAVVAPADGRYERLAGAIVEAVKRTTGATLPIVRDTDVKLPFARNLVILGNRSTNSVIEQLYNSYYTYLDLKYPGAGGYVVRSLHNPFANGHNAILVGSSDDRGMAKAVEQFAAAAADSAPCSWATTRTVPTAPSSCTRVGSAVA